MLTTKSGGKQDWQTPLWLFRYLDDRYRFELDAAASKENALCSRFYTKEDNALIQPWCRSTFCNPPWKNPLPWVKKAWAEWTYYRNKTHMVLPAIGIFSQWYWDNCNRFVTEILRPRVAFIGPKKSPNGGAMVLHFDDSANYPGNFFITDVSRFRPSRKKSK
jgi:phage N-6-adenine-methyltransferase